MLDQTIEFLKTIDTHIFVGNAIICWFSFKSFRKETQQEVRELKEMNQRQYDQLKESNQRQYDQLKESNQRHEARIDKLYEIWVETQKEIKSILLEMGKQK